MWTNRKRGQGHAAPENFKNLIFWNIISNVLMLCLFSCLQLCIQVLNFILYFARFLSVSQRTMVRILYKSESGFLSATAKVVYITAMIILHLILHSAVHIYDFHIFKTYVYSVRCHKNLFEKYIQKEVKIGIFLRLGWLDSLLYVRRQKNWILTWCIHCGYYLNELGFNKRCKPAKRTWRTLLTLWTSKVMGK